MSDQKATVRVCAIVEITIQEGSDAISRCFNDEWRESYYTFRNEAAVYEHLAFNRVANGIEDGHDLDGWSDLPRGEVTMEVVRDDVETDLVEAPR